MDHGSLFVTHDPSDPSYTNNCCEVYHKSLKSIIRVKRPNLWAFMEFLEKNLKKHDLEYQRKKNGLETGGRSKKDVENEEKRNRNILTQKHVQFQIISACFSIHPVRLYILCNIVLFTRLAFTKEHMKS